MPRKPSQLFTDRDMVITRLAVGTFLVFAALRMAAAIPQAQPGKASIEGIVTRADNGQPVLGANVTITRVAPNTTATMPLNPPPTPIAPVTTDADGKFQFKDLNPGSYRVAATATGFGSQEYGDRKIVPGISSGTPIVLTAGQSMKNAALQLKPTGTVSGKILDDMGQPAVGVPVMVVQYAYDATGFKTTRQIAAGNSDDRGEYRIYGITPGRYLIGSGNGPGPLERILVGNATTAVPYGFKYYPNVDDVNQASILEIHAGGEIVVDMTAVRQRPHTVRGRVVDATGQLVSVAALRPGQSPLSIAVAYSFLGNDGSFVFQRAYDPATGNFELPNVLPGKYTLRAQMLNTSPRTVPLTAATVAAEAQERQAAQAIKPIAELSIVVQDSDLENLVLAFTAPANVPGKVAIDGQPFSSIPQGASFQLQAHTFDGGSQNRAVVLVLNPPPDSDGMFQVVGMRAGEYRVTLGFLPGYYVKSLQFDGVDILGKTFQFSGTPGSGFNIFLSPKPGKVSGMVTDAKMQPVDALVVLIPSGGMIDRNRANLYKIGASDATGSFSISGVRPGDYKVFAWVGLEQYRYFDAEFMKQYETKGVAITVGESATMTANPQVIVIPQN